MIRMGKSRSLGGAVSGVLIVGALAGCGSSARRPGVAASFSLVPNGPDVATTSSLPSPATSSSAAEAASAAPQSVAASASPGGITSSGPCPLPAPKVFVEGKSAATRPDGVVVFRYLSAQRLCGGPDDVRYVTTGTKLTESPVSPSAVIKLLPTAGSPQEFVLPPAQLPEAIAANHSAPYYALTFDKTGTIVAITQYFHP